MLLLTHWLPDQMVVVPICGRGGGDDDDEDDDDNSNNNNDNE